MANSSNRIEIFPDEAICQQVQRFLRHRNFPAFLKLDIEVDHGSVTLTGTVSSFYEKQVAIATSSQVAGVQALVDQIEVVDHLILGQL